MDKDLEARWQEAARQKNLTQDEPRAMVEEMERGLTIAQNWNQRVEASIRKERGEIERRYGIRIGQTDIHCSSCGGPWGYGHHVCQNMRLKQLQEKEAEKQEVLKDQKEHLVDRLRKIGAKRLSTLSFEKKGNEESFIPEKTLNQWIYRRKIPSKYMARIEGLINCVLE